MSTKSSNQPSRKPSPTTVHPSRREVLYLTGAGGFAALVLAACSSADGTGSQKSAGSNLKIGILVIAQATLLDQVVSSFKSALTRAVPGRSISFDVKNAGGDQSVISTIARDFKSGDYTGFAVIGTPAVIALAKVVTDRPIFALAMGDPVGAGVAKSLDAPGTNVTGSIDYVDPERLLSDIKLIQPSLSHVGTIYDPSNQNMKVWSTALKKAAGSRGVTVDEATISGASDIGSAARSLRDRVQAVLIGPDATVIAGLDAITAITGSAKIPLYLSGGDATTKGVFASIGPDYPELGTAAGNLAAKVLAGQEAAKTAYARPTALDVQVNGATSKVLGLTVPASLKAATV